MTGNGYRDYFKVLGVERNANGDTVKRAFRRLARKYHPDVNPGDQNAEAKFKEIGEAYEVLSDPDKRRKYEQFGSYWNHADGMGGSNTSARGFDVDFGRYGNFDEFINDLLGRFGSQQDVHGSPGGAGFPKNAYQSPLSLDAEIHLKLTFSEAFYGTERTLSVDNERVQVKIPPGVKPSSRLRLKGKGNRQPGTGRRGDLYLLLDVQPHPIWRLQGSQLHADLPVSFDELVLGGNVSTITPDGEAQVAIPARTAPGKSLRLKGKGWPQRNGRGDLVFTLRLEFGPEWSSEELKLLQELKRLRCNDPRKSWLESARLSPGSTIS